MKKFSLPVSIIPEGRSEEAPRIAPAGLHLIINDTKTSKNVENFRFSKKFTFRFCQEPRSFHNLLINIDSPAITDLLSPLTSSYDAQGVFAHQLYWIERYLLTDKKKSSSTKSHHLRFELKLQNTVIFACQHFLQFQHIFDTII